MPPSIAPEIVGIAQIDPNGHSGPTTLSPGKYYFAYALNHRVDQWPKFILSDLGPAVELIATESFNAVDVYDHPQAVSGQSFATLYMTDQYPDKAAPVHWRAVNTVALGDPGSKSLLTVGLLASTGVYDAPTLNDILQTNNVIMNTIHTEGHSTAATGKIQIKPADIRSLAEAAGPRDPGIWIVIAAAVVILGLIFADAFRSVLCKTFLGNVLFPGTCAQVRALPL